MRILLITTHLEIGGLGVYTVSLADGLKGRGHEVFVASRGGALVERLKALGIDHFELNIGTKSELSPRLILAYSTLRHLIEQHRIEVVHAQTRVAQVISRIATRRARIAYVATAHGFFRPALGRRLFPCWGDMTIAVSEAVERHLINDFSVDPARIKVIYNGIDMRRFETTPDEGALNAFRSRLGIGSGSVVGTIARLSPVKGLVYLIEAMRRLAQIRPELRLLIVGSGPAKPALLRLISDLRLGDKVRIIDSVIETYLPLGVMNVFVLSSIQEGLGISLLEAMAYGVPVVASNVGGVSSIIADGTNGIAVPPRDPEAIAKAVITLIDNKQLAKRLVQEAHKTVEEKFTLTQMVKNTEAVYREAAEDGK